MVENKTAIFALSPNKKGDYFYESGKNKFDDLRDWYIKTKKNNDIVLKPKSLIKK